jgi:hypothetical protein
VRFEVVKLPVKISVSDYLQSDLYADSFRKYVKISENDVKVVIDGRFLEKAEIGYRQVYKTIEKNVEKPREWYSDRSSIYFLFKNKDNKNVVICVDVYYLVECYESNSFDHKERGKKPRDDDIILFEGVYPLTTASSITMTYWIEKEVFEILREEAKKLVKKLV